MGTEEDKGTKGDGLGGEERRRRNARSEVEEDDGEGEHKATQLKGNHTEDRQGERGGI